MTWQHLKRGTLLVWVPTQDGLMLAADDYAVTIFRRDGGPVTDLGFSGKEVKIETFKQSENGRLLLFGAFGSTEGWTAADANPSAELLEGPPTWDAKRSVRQYLYNHNFQINDRCLGAVGERLKNEFLDFCATFETDGTVFGISFGEYWNGTSKIGVVEILKGPTGFFVRLHKTKVYTQKDTLEIFLNGEAEFVKDQVVNRRDCLIQLKAAYQHGMKIRECSRAQAMKLATETIGDSNKVAESLNRLYKGKTLAIGPNPSLLFSSGSQTEQL